MVVETPFGKGYRFMEKESPFPLESYSKTGSRFYKIYDTYVTGRKGVSDFVPIPDLKRDFETITKRLERVRNPKRFHKGRERVRDKEVNLPIGVSLFQKGEKGESHNKIP